MLRTRRDLNPNGMYMRKSGPFRSNNLLGINHCGSGTSGGGGWWLRHRRAPSQMPDHEPHQEEAQNYQERDAAHTELFYGNCTLGKNGWHDGLNLLSSA